MPFLPERDLNFKNEAFFDRFYKHLKMDSSAMLLKNGKKCDGSELLATYKYIFKNPIDWTGPLSYFRNLLFYRVKANNSVG
jgi:hypothetical protein